MGWGILLCPSNSFINLFNAINILETLGREGLWGGGVEMNYNWHGGGRGWIEMVG